MIEYLDLLDLVLRTGVDKPNRTGTHARSLFGHQLRFDLSKGFPILTTKKIFFKGIVHELLWFLNGDTNVQYLQKHGVRFWDEWAREDGELGPVYGAQWRNWRTANGDSIDQIANLVSQLKSDPHSRRHIISAWNVGELDEMALPPCHAFFQFYVAEGRLSCHLYQRSADIFLGVPFNISSYALLTHMIAQVVGLKVGDFIHSFGDVHLYSNHISEAEEQLSRTPYPIPKLWLNPEVKDIDAFRYEDIRLVEYQSHSTIRAPIAV